MWGLGTFTCRKRDRVDTGRHKRKAVGSIAGDGRQDVIFDPHTCGDGGFVIQPVAGTCRTSCPGDTSLCPVRVGRVDGGAIDSGRCGINAYGGALDGTCDAADGKLQIGFITGANVAVHP